jgi:hypothetical protein
MCSSLKSSSVWLMIPEKGFTCIVVDTLDIVHHELNKSGYTHAA